MIKRKSQLRSAVPFILLATFSLLHSACSSDDDSTTGADILDPLRISIATGVTLTGNNGETLNVAGNPNNFGSAIAFPNPSTGDFAVTVADSPPLDKVYVINAAISKDYADVDMNEAFRTFEGYSVERLKLVTAAESDPGDGVATVRLDVSNLPAGYYRVITIDESGGQDGQTVYIDPSATDIDVLRMQVIADWQ